MSILCRGLVSSYSSDIGIYSDYIRLGNRYATNKMLMSVQLRIFYMCTYSHCISSPAEARFVSLICTSHNETYEDSHTGSRTHVY